MGIPPPDAQRIASLVPDQGQGKTCTIDEALELEPKLKALVEAAIRSVEELLDTGEEARGAHAARRHARGGRRDQRGPARRTTCRASPATSTIVTQYDKDDVEAAGLVKFDFLGLKTLTVIDIARAPGERAPRSRGQPARRRARSRSTTATPTRSSRSGETTGVFQLESSGMQQLLKRLQPDCFEDIVAAVALYRPGPLGTGMIDDFIGGKHGTKADPQAAPAGRRACSRRPTACPSTRSR